MSINSKQLRYLVIQPALKAMGWWSESAENLLMGTAAVESCLGSYLKQIEGPALGIFQMEPATYNWLTEHYLCDRPSTRLKLLSVLGYNYMPSPDRMIWDMRLAVLLARLKYLTIPEGLPSDPNNIEGLAKYWKKYYNTPKGAGTPAKFMGAYEKFVL